VADARTRQVVLIVEDVSLGPMAAVGMGRGSRSCEVLEAPAPTRPILLLEARRDITMVFTDVEMPGSMDRLRIAQRVRGRMRADQVSSRRRPFTSVRDGDLPSGGLFFARTLQPCRDFQRLTGRHRPNLEQGLLGDCARASIADKKSQAS